MVTTASQETKPVNTVVRFLDALERLDFAALETCFAEDVWFRALLSRTFHESRAARDTAAIFRGWFEGMGGSRLVEADHHTMAGRVFVRYRFLVRPEWAPDQWHVIEQTGFCRIKQGRISRLDIACSGYFPA